MGVLAYRVETPDGEHVGTSPSRDVAEDWRAGCERFRRTPAYVVPVVPDPDPGE